jgi:hypothetical protein
MHAEIESKLKSGNATCHLVQNVACIDEKCTRVYGGETGRKETTWKTYRHEGNVGVVTTSSVGTSKYCTGQKEIYDSQTFTGAMGGWRCIRATCRTQDS